jgi:hypothetical protein
VLVTVNFSSEFYILPCVVVWGEGRGLNVFGDMSLRRIFRPNGQDGRGMQHIWGEERSIQGFGGETRVK